jgi:hypothetical protein
MTKLAIMTRDLTSYFMPPSPLVTRNAYETDKAWHIKPDGWTVTMGFSASRFSWRPKLTIRRSAAWLWFAISWERDYQQVPGMVIADHLGAHLAQEARNAI